MRDLYNVHFRYHGKNFILLLKYANENGYTYEDILQAADTVKRRGAKRLSLDQLRVALKRFALLLFIDFVNVIK